MWRRCHEHLRACGDSPKTSRSVTWLQTLFCYCSPMKSQRPWSFDKYLISLYQPSASKLVDDARFDTSSFWIQIHNLPLIRMNKANATAIGSTIGRVEQVEASPSGECRGRCIRVRISINIEQPLCRGRYVDLGDSDPIGSPSNMNVCLSSATSVVA